MPDTKGRPAYLASATRSTSFFHVAVDQANKFLSRVRRMRYAPSGEYISFTGDPSQSTIARRHPDTASYSTTAALVATARTLSVGCQASTDPRFVSPPYAVSERASERVRQGTVALGSSRRRVHARSPRPGRVWSFRTCEDASIDSFAMKFTKAHADGSVSRSSAWICFDCVWAGAAPPNCWT